MNRSTPTSSDAERWVYLDYNATAPLRDPVRLAMAPLLGAEYGNPSSQHGPGRAARLALTRARREIATLLDSGRDDVVFTGNGSEANLLALAGVVRALPASRRHVLTSPVEHPSVLDPLQSLAAAGRIDLELLSVDGNGRAAVEDVARRLRDDTGLVSVMAANNELGTVQPIAGVAELLRQHPAVLHCDASQGVGKLPLAAFLDADLITFSPHKIGGPRGVGVLVRHRPVVLDSPLSAGRQEHGLRGGTEDVAAAVGSGVALCLALEEQPAEATRLGQLANEIRSGLSSLSSAVVFHSPREDVLPGVVNFSVPEVPGSWLVAALDRRRVAVSHGSACSSLAALPSHVLEAVGAGELAACAVRISMGRGSSEEDVRMALERTRSALLEISNSNDSP